MEVKSIIKSIDLDSDLTEEVKNEIIMQITKINRAKNILDGVEESLLTNAQLLSEEEVQYIRKKCISYKKLFRIFESGGVVDYEHISKIADRVMLLEEGIKNNDFAMWRDEFMSGKGTIKDEKEDEEIDGMLVPINEDNKFIENLNKIWDKITFNVKDIRENIASKVSKIKEEQKRRKEEKQQNKIKMDLSDEEEEKIENISKEHEMKRRRRRNIEVSLDDMNEEQEMTNLDSNVIKAVKDAINEEKAKVKEKNLKLAENILSLNLKDGQESSNVQENYNQYNIEDDNSSFNANINTDNDTDIDTDTDVNSDEIQYKISANSSSMEELSSDYLNKESLEESQSLKRRRNLN